MRAAASAAATYPVAKSFMRTYLDFEKPVRNSTPRSRVARARRCGRGVAIGDEIGRLEGKANLALKGLYANLTPGRRRRSPVIRNAAFIRLRRAPVHRIHTARGRPQIRRGRRDPGGFAAFAAKACA